MRGWRRIKLRTRAEQSFLSETSCGLSNRVWVEWQGGEALLEIAYQLGDLQPDIILNSHELFLGITHWLRGLWSVRADRRALIAFGSKLRGRGRWRGHLSETVGDAKARGEAQRCDEGCRMQ